MNKEIEIPEGYEARIDGNKVILEQKEGDDELIRKRLINLIKELAAAKLPIATGGYFIDGQDRKYIAYLEKQKEQKPLSTEEAEINSLAFLEQIGYTCIPPGKEQKQIKFTDLTWEDIVELEGIINNVHYDFSAGIGQESFGNEVLERFRSKKGIEYLDEAEQKCWLENQKEQKPAEWSEEDEYVYNEILKRVADKKLYEHDLEYIYKWLKSIRPQSKQVCSEEDEKIREELYEYFRQLQLMSDREFSPSLSIDEILSWLKSLRLQQEQQECLYGKTLEEREKYCKFCALVCEAKIKWEEPEVDLEKEPA